MTKSGNGKLSFTDFALNLMDYFKPDKIEDFFILCFVCGFIKPSLKSSKTIYIFNYGF